MSAGEIVITMKERLVEGGMPPPAAADYLSKLFDDMQRRKPDGWFLFFGETGRFMCVDEAPETRVRNLRNVGVAVSAAKVAELAESCR